MSAEICYPPGADWSCAYSEEQLAEMWGNPDLATKMRRSEALAWSTLAALTADQIGTCPITVRPCKLGCRNSDTYLAAPVAGLSGRFNPHINSAGNWVNSCGCTTDCSCTTLCEAILPGPVGDIVEIMLDGAVLDPSAYRVDNGNRLVRTDGGCWPACQDMAKPGNAQYEPVVVETASHRATYYRTGQTVRVTVENNGIGGNMPTPAPWAPEYGFQMGLPAGGMFVMGAGSTDVSGASNAYTGIGEFTYGTDAPAEPNDALGTFEVTYYRGAAPDAILLWVSGLLAVEWFKACNSDKTCRLPRGVRSISRQGVNYEIQSNLFSQGTTGIAEVDAVVARYNPFGLKMAPTISTPQTIRRPRQTTWSSR